MKKTIAIIITAVMLLSMVAIAPVTAEAALNSTQINLYKNELKSIHNSPLSYVDLFNQNTKDIEKCSFTVVDVNDDGTDDLVVRFENTYTAAMHSRVYTVKNGNITYLGNIGVACEFYKNGYYTSKVSHNQTPGFTIWPYSIGKYNSSKGKLEYFASAYCADRNHPLANKSGGYYDYTDYDNDGVIYLVNENISTGNTKAFTKAQYNAFVDKYIPAKNKKAVNWQKITMTNINNLGKATSVKLNRSTLSLGVGENYGLLKTVVPNFANQSVTWTTSNSSVATVSSTGSVIGKKAGTATVTVKTSNGKTASCKVTVKAAPSSVKTNPTSLKLGVGETYTISESTNSGSYANAANLRWSSSNTSVATIVKITATNKAVITANKAGTSNITVKTYNGKSYTCKLTVYPAPSSVKLSTTSITLSKGKTYTISENSPSGSYANAANLKWTSSNTKVATVTKGSGNKATIKTVAKGTAYVKITLYNGKTAQCKVTVK